MFKNVCCLFTKMLDFVTTTQTHWKTVPVVTFLQNDIVSCSFHDTVKVESPMKARSFLSETHEHESGSVLLRVLGEITKECNLHLNFFSETVD